MTKMYMRGSVYYGTGAEMMDRIDELEAALVATCQREAKTISRHDAKVETLEAKLAEAEARSEVLETLIMDVAADLYDGVDAYKIDQRIGDVMKQLDDEEEEDQ